MRMHLKKKRNILKNIKHSIKFNNKNLLIFLIFLFIFSFILGIIFFFFLDKGDKVLSNSIIDSYFNIKNNSSIIVPLRESILEKTFNIFLIWILGISIIGILLVIVIYFFHGFSLGYTLSSLIYKYKIKGIIYFIGYISVSKIIFIFLIFLITFFSIKVSYKFIKLCFSKQDINIKPYINKYFKVLFYSFILVIFISLVEVLIDPFIINLFTKI